MNDPVARALLVVPGLPALAALGLFVAGRRISDRARAAGALLASGGALTVLTALVVGWPHRLLFGSSDAEPPPAWLAVGGASPIDATLRLAPTAAGAWFAVVVLVVSLLVFWRRCTRAGIAPVYEPAARSDFFVEEAAPPLVDVPLGGMALLAATLWALLTADLLTWFVAWQTTSVTGALLAAGRGTEAGAGSGARRMLLVHRALEAAPLFGVILTWSLLRTTDLSVLNPDASGTVPAIEQLLGPEYAEVDQRHHAAMVHAICLAMLAGAAVRCGAFPLFGWLRDATTSADGDPDVDVLLQAGCGLPLAVHLLATFQPVFASAPQAMLATIGTGGVTVLAAGLVALNQPDERSAFAYGSACVAGWAMLGASGPFVFGPPAAIAFATTFCLARTGLSLAGPVRFGEGTWQSGREPDSGRAAFACRLACGALLATGISGGQSLLSAALDPSTIDEAWPTFAAAAGSERGTYQMSVADATLEAAPDAGEFVDAEPMDEPVQGRRRLVLFSGIMALGGTLLAALAWFRAIFRTRRSAEGTGSAPGIAWPALAATALAVAIGPLLSDPEGRLERHAQRVDADEAAHRAERNPATGAEGEVPAAPEEYVLFETYAFGLGVWPALLGMVLAWMFWGQDSAVPERAARTFGALARLGRNRWYVDEATSLAVSLPLRATAHLARFADWIAVDGVFARLPAWLVRRAGRTGDALRLGIVQYQALGMLLAGALLLLVLSRFGGRR